jgi:histidyl-tRNA synthetase
MPSFQAPKGTFDVLFPQSARYEAFFARFARLVEAAGYGLILSPMFEDIGVFQRVGESTDIVRKEMYDFQDKAGRHMALRPEGTASVVRAFIQHRPTLPWKTWYGGPNFRYDRPAAGRYRQHHQVGIEAIGSEDPDLDAEVIDLAWQTYAAVGLRQVELHLNSMGDATCRPAYRQALIDHLRPIVEAGGLSDEHRTQYLVNPLRVLDCKKPDCVKATADAPRMLDYLCEPCAEHFSRVRQDLDQLGIPVVIDTRLVRGQDYYTRTTFEFVGLALDAAQNGIGGGGRYDGLSEALGGPPAPGIGFGLGIERILLAADAEGVFPAPATVIDVFVIDLIGGSAALELCHALRAAGIGADRAFGARPIGAQLKAADRSGARIALIVGEDEAAAGEVTIKDLRGDEDQQRVNIGQAVEALRAKLAGS